MTKPAKSLVGTEGNDVLEGSLFADAMTGLGGNDTLFGRFGADTLDGGEGDDTIFGGAGSDQLIGAAGADTLFGEDGCDILEGGDGDDLLDGGRGTDKLAGGAGVDTLIGGNGADTLVGGDGVDTLIGGAGRDSFVFDETPFTPRVATGTGRIADDGVRQAVNGADTATDNVIDFDLKEDRFLFDADEMGLDHFTFVNAARADGSTDLSLITGDANVLVVGSFGNAGLAANAIATAYDFSGPGLFVYFNEALNVNRIVYSEDLGANGTTLDANGNFVGTGDIDILLALRNQTGQEGVEALPLFEADNFGFA